MSKHLSNSERLRSLEEYLSTSVRKYAIQNKYGLSTGPILFYLHKSGLSLEQAQQTVAQAVLMYNEVRPH